MDMEPLSSQFASDMAPWGHIYMFHAKQESRLRAKILGMRFTSFIRSQERKCKVTCSTRSINSRKNYHAFDFANFF